MQSVMFPKLSFHVLVTGAAEMDLLGSTSSSEDNNKGQRGIEFVKHYRTHLAPIQDMQVIGRVENEQKRFDL